MPSTTPVAGFAELYERHYEAVFRAALRVTGNPADAEDVLQTVFLRALAGSGDVGNVTLPAAYFRRAAVNAAVDVLRRRELRADSVYDDSAPHAAVQHPVLLKERLRRAPRHPGPRRRKPVPAASRRRAVERRAGGDVRNREKQRGRQAAPDPAAPAGGNGTLGARQAVAKKDAIRLRASRYGAQDGARVVRVLARRSFAKAGVGESKGEAPRLRR